MQRLVRRRSREPKRLTAQTGIAGEITYQGNYTGTLLIGCGAAHMQSLSSKMRKTETKKKKWGGGAHFFCSTSVCVFAAELVGWRTGRRNEPATVWKESPPCGGVYAWRVFFLLPYFQCVFLTKCLPVEDENGPERNRANRNPKQWPTYGPGFSFIAPRSRDRNRLKQTQARQKKRSRRRKRMRKSLPPSKGAKLHRNLKINSSQGS